MRKYDLFIPTTFCQLNGFVAPWRVRWNSSSTMNPAFWLPSLPSYGARQPLSEKVLSQGTDGLAGSLCSLSGGDVAGYKFTTCKDNLVCAPLANSSLAGTGAGFCNLTSGGQVSRRSAALMATLVRYTSYYLFICM